MSDSRMRQSSVDIRIIRFNTEPNGDYRYCLSGEEPESCFNVYEYTGCWLEDGVWYGYAYGDDSPDPLCTEEWNDIGSFGSSELPF